MCNQCVPLSKKPTPHVHAEIMKKWADDTSQTVEFRETQIHKWKFTDNPSWNKDYEYRIRPEPKPDKEYFVRLCKDAGSQTAYFYPSLEGLKKFCLPACIGYLKMTYDGETGIPKKSEIVLW